VLGTPLAGRQSWSGVLTFATTRPRRGNASRKQIALSRIIYGFKPSAVGLLDSDFVLMSSIEWAVVVNNEKAENDVPGGGIVQIMGCCVMRIML